MCLLRGICELLQGRLDFNPPLCILFINSVGMVSSLMSVAYAWCVRNVETKLATAARDKWVVLPLIQPLHLLAFDYWVTPSSFHNTLSSLAVANVGGSCKCACDKKDGEFESQQERLENFLLQSQFSVLTLIQCPFHPRVTAVACKDPGHSAKSAGGRLRLNVHTALAQRSWSGLTMPLSRHSVGAYQETSSHAIHQGTFSHSHLSSLSHCGLILAERMEFVCVS